MDRHKDNYRTVSRRRRISDEAKVRIVEEGFSGDGRQVLATAAKHDVSRAQLYRWRRLLREGRLGGVRIDGFVPAVITPEGSRLEDTVSCGGQMEVVSANGRRVIVDRDVDVEALLRILRGVETLR